MPCWKGYFRTIDGHPVYFEPDCSKEVSIVAVVLILSALAGGTVAVASSIGGAASAAVEQSLQARTTNSKESARKGQYGETWKRLRLRSPKQALKQVDRDFRCALHSTGQVREFFVRDPCRSLQRTLIPLVDADGDTIIVAIAWVRMLNASAATRLGELIGAEGTGGIEPLAGAPLGYDGVEFTGRHYAVRCSGDLVVVAEATTWRGQPASAVLDSLAEVATDFPAP